MTSPAGASKGVDSGPNQASITFPDFRSMPAKFGWPTESPSGYRIDEKLAGEKRKLRVIHIGCGASGICISKFLPERLTNVSLVCYDKNPDIGGTWLENRYPGCACDIPSVNYQFTWARNPDWSHFYAGSPEIWQYFKDIVDVHGLRKYMRLNHLVEHADWNEQDGVWTVRIRNLITNETFLDTAEILINGGGILNHWKWPDIQGLHDFKGTLCHTARYDTTIDLEGKTVAVIGIGSSGIQVIANIAPKVKQLYTWIRSPTWITAGFAEKFAGPQGANFAYTDEQRKHWRENYLDYLQYCKDVEAELNQRFKFILNNTPDAIGAKEFSINEMKSKLGSRTDLMDKIIPKDFGIGCRRPTPGNGFLEALTMPHVHSFSREMKKITERGFLDDEGNEHDVDVIICATGFNTSWVPRFPIIANGTNVQDVYRKKPLSYISVGVPDFPNYFTVTGPYGPLGHGSYLGPIERLINHFILMIEKMQVEDIKSLAPKREVAEQFAEHAEIYYQRCAWSSGCSSWFKNGTTDGQLTIWPGSRLLYLDVLAGPRYEHYTIKYLSGNAWGFLGNGFTLREYDGSDLSPYLGTKEEPGALLLRPSKANGITPTSDLQG